MNKEPQACSSRQEELLEEGVEKIVVSRERTPRNPRWQRAWWRTLERFNARLRELHQTQPSQGSEPCEGSEKEHP